MPDVPPFHEFAMRYPAFEAVPPSRVELALSDAAESLSWERLGDRTWRTAVMLKAAHELTVSGLGTGMEATMAANGLSGFASVRDGEVSATRTISAVRSALNTTEYGRALEALLRHSAVRLVTAGTDEPLHPRGSPEGRRE